MLEFITCCCNGIITGGLGTPVQSLGRPRPPCPPEIINYISYMKYNDDCYNMERECEVQWHMISIVLTHTIL